MFLRNECNKKNKIKSNKTGNPMVSLTILFIILKIFGAIDWSWIWVLSPLWLPFVFGISVILGIIILILLFDNN